MRVVAPDLPGRGRSAPVAHAEDYGTPLYLAVDGRAHRAPRREGSRLGGHLARRPYRNGAGRAAGKSNPAPGAQRLRCARACCRVAAHRQLSAEHPDLSHADGSRNVPARDLCAVRRFERRAVAPHCRAQRHRRKRATAAELRSEDRRPSSRARCSWMSLYGACGSMWSVQCSSCAARIPTCSFPRRSRR